MSKKRRPRSGRHLRSLARHCAFGEREGYDLPTVSGTAVLTMLYANGLGVEPSVELAQMFNCEVGGSIQEIASDRSAGTCLAEAGRAGVS